MANYHLYNTNLVANVSKSIFTAASPGKIVRISSSDNSALLKISIGSLEEMANYYRWIDLRDLNYDTGEQISIQSNIATTIRVETIEDIGMNVSNI